MLSVVNTQPPPLPPPPGGRGLVWWHYLCIAAALLIAIGFGGLLFIGIRGPEAFVETGSRMPAHRKAKIRTVAGLATNETILYFYSAALLDIAGDGNLLTDRGVYSWYQDRGLHLDRARFHEIADVDVEYTDTWFVDTDVTVTLTNGDSLFLALPRERGGDRKFAEALRKAVRAGAEARTPPE